MPKAKRQRRYGLAIALGASGLLVLSAPVWGTHLGQRLDWFDVNRVEISGATLIAPHEVLRTSGIRSGNSILDEREAWETALEAHPVIAEAAVSWRLPNTLRVRVVEERPVALVGSDALEPATAAGTILPLDPIAVPLDLPIVPGSPDDPESGADVRKALAEVGRLSDLDPELISDVSEIRISRSAPGSLLLIHEVGEILIPMNLPESRLDQLHAVVADVASRFRPAAGGSMSPQWLRIDLRFEDQIVVRHSSARELS